MEREDLDKERKIRETEQVAMRDNTYIKLAERNQDYYASSRTTQQEVENATSNVKAAKEAEPAKSLYEIIKEELSKYDTAGLTADEAQGRLPVKYLQEARKILIDKAKELGVLENLKGEIDQIQNLESRSGMLAKLKEISKNADKEKYGNKTTKLGKNSMEIPYYDLKGVTKDYTEVAYLVTELAFLEADLKVGERKSDDEVKNNAQVKQLRRKIALYGWENPAEDHFYIFSQAIRIERKRLQELEDRQLTRMASQSRAEYSQTSQLPRGIGAAFMHGIAENMAKQTGAPGGHIVEVLNLVKEEGGKMVANKYDLGKWLNKNFYAFLTRNVEPEKTWKAHMEFWINNDLMAALRLYEVEMLHDKRGEALIEARRQYDAIAKEAQKAKEELYRRMSIHAAVEAQKASGGSHTAYGIYMIGDDGRGDVNLDALDLSGAPELIEQHADYYDEVYQVEGAFGDRVRSNYEQIINGMGLAGNIDEIEIDRKKNKVTKQSKINGINIKEFVNRTTGMFKFIREGGGGFDSWIEARLDAEDKKNNDEFLATGVRQDLPSRDERWLAAKTAVDLFMVDGKYTKWKASLRDSGIEGFEDTGRFLMAGEKAQKGHDEYVLFTMDPFKKWGGDPLASTEFAPTLAHNIKKTFGSEKGKRLMKEVALAFRPSDVIDEQYLIPISGVGTNFKMQVRYNRAVGKFMGGSRGQGIADWGKDGIMGVKDMVELVDTYWGSKSSFRLKDGGPKDVISGKQLEGVIVSRLLKVKAEAKINESRAPALGERLFRPLSLEMEDPRSRPNSEALQWLLGQDMKGRSGYLAELMGDRMNIKFKGEARRLLRQTIDMLDSNDQSNFWRSLSKLLGYVGIGMGIAVILTQFGLKISGADVELMGDGGRKQRK